MKQQERPSLINYGTEKFALSSYFTSFLIFGIIIRLSWKKWSFGRNGQRKRDSGKENWENLPGLEVLPGPTSWDPTGIIGNLLDFLPIEEAMKTGLKYSKTFGDIWKVTGIKQTWVVFNSPSAVQRLMKSSDMGHLRKSPEIYNKMKPFLKNTVGVIKDEQLWKARRKLLLKSQSLRNLKAYMPMLNKHCKTFVSSLEGMFEDGESHQINELINSSVIKIICEMITGFNDDPSEEYTRYHHNFHTWKKCLVYRILHPWFLFRPLWKFHPLSTEDDQAIGEMFEFARKVWSSQNLRIQEHKENRAEQLKTGKPEVLEKTSNPNEFRSVLDDLLVEEGVEEEEIVDEINGLIFGGHDPGAATIHFFCFAMALNPEIQERCQTEVDEIFEDSASFQNETLAFEAASCGLKLVERCISETLRLFPPAFLFSRKLSSPLKINYNGRDVLLPPGTNAVITPFSLHQQPEYFPEPEKFDPDRFLPEECAKRHPYAFVPFSAGPRNCLGMKFAMIKMKTMAAYILRHFSITTTDRMGDILLLPLTTTTPAKDYTFRFIKRAVN